MLDKTEPPTVPDGYGLSLAFLCMLDIVKCVQGLIQMPAVGNPSASSSAEISVANTAGEMTSCR